MNSLSSLERVVLETLVKQCLVYEEIQYQSGLQENVCFNVLQALVIRGFVSTDGLRYKIAENISPFMLEEINSAEAKTAESMEMIEAVLDQKNERVFRFQKIAMDSRDEKIFMAMLSNLETFLSDAHKKAQSTVPMKERKVVFWGVGDVKSALNQIVMGN